MSGPAIERLTDAQRECLRLVLTHHSSKEIALQLGVSPSAIDKRLERAVQILGAGSRFEAARLLGMSEVEAPYERMPSERIDLPDPSSPMPLGPHDGSFGTVRRLFGLDPRVGQSGTARNSLSRMQRIAIMISLVIGLAIAALIMAAVATTLTQLVKAEPTSGSGLKGGSMPSISRTG